MTDEENAGVEETTSIGSANQESVSIGSAFDPENILPALLITLTRVYDVQMALLKSNNPLIADVVRKKHANGELLSAPPRLSVPGESND